MSTAPVITQAPVKGIVAGQTGKFTAQVFDAEGNLITDPAILAELSYAWTSSDETNEPVVESGSSASIAVPAGATPNQGATLGVTVTGDGVNLSNSVQVPVLAAPVVPTTVIITEQ